VVKAIGAPSLQVWFDLDHCRIVAGVQATKIRQCLPTGRVRDFLIAGVPMRREPDPGDLPAARVVPSCRGLQSFP